MTKIEAKPAVASVNALFSKSPDGLCEIVRAVMQEMLEAEMTDALGAEKGERTAARLDYRSGYYTRNIGREVANLSKAKNNDLRETYRSFSIQTGRRSPHHRDWGTKLYCKLTTESRISSCSVARAAGGRQRGRSGQDHRRTPGTAPGRPQGPQAAKPHEEHPDAPKARASRTAALVKGFRSRPWRNDDRSDPGCGSERRGRSRSETLEKSGADDEEHNHLRGDRLRPDEAGGSGVDALPFGGSGTTLVAAEKTGRTARLVEYDAAYCDTIVRRFEQATGKTANLAETGQDFEATRHLRQGTAIRARDAA